MGEDASKVIIEPKGKTQGCRAGEVRGNERIAGTSRKLEKEKRPETSRVKGRLNKQLSYGKRAKGAYEKKDM